MTRAAQQILQEFEALPHRDRSELMSGLARRAALAPHESPSDDDLTSAADRLFRELDRDERA